MAVSEEKYRRMELRKATGTRVIEPPEPPPFHRGPQYLVAHACFDCRKSYKRKVEDREYKHRCPECDGQMYEMGRSFKAPKSSDTRQWTKVNILYAEGFRFIGCGSHDGLPLPAKLSDLESFLRDNVKHPLRVAAPNKQILRKFKASASH